MHRKVSKWYAAHITKLRGFEGGDLTGNGKMRSTGGGGGPRGHAFVGTIPLEQ